LKIREKKMNKHINMSSQSEENPKVLWVSGLLGEQGRQGEFCFEKRSLDMHYANPPEPLFRNVSLYFSTALP
jgi:hypothetical protein